LPRTTIPLLLLLFGLRAVVGNFIGGAFSDRYGPQWPTVICLMMPICTLATIKPASSSIAGASVTMVGDLYGRTLYDSAAARDCGNSQAFEFGARPQQFCSASRRVARSGSRRSRYMQGVSFLPCSRESGRRRRRSIDYTNSTTVESAAHRQAYQRGDWAKIQRRVECAEPGYRAIKGLVMRPLEN
jgi:hypothetical protein